MTFVLLSLTVFVLETYPFFKQAMTAEDYAEYYQVDLDDLLKNGEGDRPPGVPVRTLNGFSTFYLFDKLNLLLNETCKNDKKEQRKN